MNLIDRDNAVKALSSKAKQAYNKNNRLVYMIYKDAAELVDKLPTVDSFPDVPALKYGCKDYDAAAGESVCSECGWSFEDTGGWDYCPHCGTKWVGDNEWVD